MSIKKQFLKSKDKYKVTWAIDKKAVKDAESITLAGDFNDWSLNENSFKKLKSGNFTLTLVLDKDADYQFRYLVNGTNWMNEAEADAFVDNSVSNEQNCVLSL